ncbi:PLxRFG domain-containing protein [Delftia acidovorans]|uniref:PLxRFG domain-containing protein n=1 Tax=Delftia acidovorans TaxID=80866 RepID=A0A7T2S628_DELAC|nr:PLxRFG domain-containing protein [Delftia acidovorans]QPS09557.1 PLxRFG domain-containing protein [Delftia acidovorans]
MPEAVVGLADIATGGRAGKILENEGGAVGFRPKQAREIISGWHSRSTLEAQRKFQEAEGLGGKFKAAVENPSNVVGAVVESLPAMGAGGVVARGLGAATRLGQAGAKGAAAAGALGEGIVGTGSAAEQIRQETDDGLLSPGQVAAAAATGAATAGFGYAGGRMAQRLGIGDAETMLAQGNKGIAKQFADDAATAATNPLLQQRAVKSIPRQVIEGAISEGFLEELPQSVAEQIFQNLALGKDWSQDVDTAVVLGTLSGAAMGGGAAGYRAVREPRVPAGQPGEAAAQPPGAGAEPASLPDVATYGAAIDQMVRPESQQQYRDALARAQDESLAPEDRKAAADSLHQAFNPDLFQQAGENQADGQVPSGLSKVRDEFMRQLAAQQEPVIDEARLREQGITPAPQLDTTRIDAAIGAPRPSEVMGLDPAAGSLSAAAALAVDSGAAAQTQQASAMAQAAEQAARAPAKKKASEHQVTADPATGEIAGGALATWTDEDLSNAFRSAQAKEVRIPLANELQRRRAEREQQARAAAPAPTSTTTQQGSIDGTQADQAQPPRTESSPAAGAQGAPVAGPAAAQELTYGITSSQHDGAQAGAAPSPQTQAPVQTPAQRIDAGRAAWASMPTAERKALAKRVGGANAALKNNLHGARWENLNAELQLRLADAIQVQGATNDSTAPAVRLAAERPASPAAASAAGGSQPAGRAPDAQPAGPGGSSAGQPAAGVQSAVPGRSGASEQAAGVAPAAAPAPTAGQQQAVAIAKEGNDARRAQLLAASERWTSMPAAERQAVAGKAKGLNALAKASSHTRAWADLAPKVREKLAAAMPDAVAAPAAPAAPAARAPARSVEGRDLGDGWAEFSRDSGSIGVPRAEMPQIRAEHRGAMVNFMNARGIAHQEESVPASSLKPTQAEFSRERVARARGFEGGNRSILVSRDGHVLDGHHQWLAAREAGEDVKVIRLDAPIRELLDAAREFPSSTTSEGAAQAPAPDSAQQQAIKEHGLPAETQFKPGKGALGSGKWTASVSGQSSALSSTVDEAAKSLAGFLSMDRARADAETQRQALAGTVAEKLKRGEKPTDVELRDLFGLAPNHTYVEQAAVGQFLVDHMAVPRNGIRKALGAAAGDRTSDSGAKYPIVYPRKLHEVFSPKQADAAPAPRPPRGVLAKKAKAEEAARADYFTPGNIVKGYGDSHVRVVSYTPANADGVWSVTVRQVEKQGSGWEDVPGVRERTHATPPSARELKAGPVERTEDLPFRRGEADGQGLTDDQMANLLRIMRPEPAAFSAAARAQAVGQVRATVDAIRKGWSNGPEVVVAFDMSDPAVPEAARRADLRQRSGGASGAPEGFYWRGKAYLLASKLNTPADAARVLHHEVLGHHGLRGMFGPELNKILNQVATMRKDEVAAKIKEYGLRGVTDLSRRHAAEEVLAEMAEKTPQLHFVRRAVAAIRNWLRANVPGFRGLKLSDADIIQGYILPARDFVERGQRAATDRIEPSFSRGTAEMSLVEKARVLQGEPVALLRGDEAPHGYPLLRAWAAKLFQDAGGQAMNPELGAVVLDERAVRDSMAHRMNPFKAAAFAAVKDVLENGVVVVTARHGNTDSFYVSAPVQIRGIDDIVTVLVRRDPDTQRMYLHSVATKESLLAPINSEADGAEAPSEQNGLLQPGDASMVAQAAADGKVSPKVVAAVLRQFLRVNTQSDEEGSDLMFSRSRLGDSPAAQRAGEVLRSITVTNVKQQTAYKATDLRPLGLQFLGRRQLVDVYGDMLPELRTYSDLMARMDADKNEAGAGADQLAQDWAKLSDERALAELMHDATLAQMDPSEEHVDGDDRVRYAMLRGRFNALTPAAREVYKRARDTYTRHMQDVRSAIKERIERAGMSSDRKAAMLKRMDDEFFGHIKGVYFPLARFGQYVVVVKDAEGKTASVSRAETMAEADAMRGQMVAAFPKDKGFTVGKVLKAKDFVAERDTVGRGFMEQLYGVLDKQGMDAKQRAELEDALGQLYLSSLPDLSWAKHGIHRKGTAGFSQDARRAFAQNVFHGASYLAKLRYGDQLQDQLGEMQRRVDQGAGDADFDSIKGQQVVDEMVKRHDAAMNPKTNALSTALTSVGFMFHLGLSPASAMVNLTQTALVAYPVMGARWGFRKSAAALLKASQEAVRGKNDITGSLSPDEKAAYDEAVRSGVIDVTMAHDLAGIAQGEDRNVSHKLRPVMNAASWMFHHAEKFNRQVTFMAAYRLARETGTSQQQAYQDAVQATYDGHFDYSANNRPRIMQGNVARVLLLFKQYGQNMVYTLVRNAQQAMAAAKPEDRAAARKALAGLLTTHAMAAGVLGLPMVTTLLAAASMLGGDDDEPWDAQVAMQNMLADAFGQKPAEVLSHGLSRLTPWDISGRVGLDRLILPDVQEGLEGQRLGESAMAAALGPVAGIGINALKGLQEMSEGRYQRGLETMAPSVLRGPLKAWRYETEGVKDKTGIVVQDQVDAAAVAGQAVGFSPSSVRNAYEGKAAIVGQDRALQARRSALVEQFAMAAMAKDEEGKTEAREAIQRFNEKNPARRIQPMQLAQSVRMREKRIREAEDGAYLPKKRRDVMEAGRFAVQE